MKVLILRNMTVANAKGEAETFEKSDVPITIDDVETYRRLNRAGAAVVHTEPEGKSEEGGNTETVADLMKLGKDELVALAKAEEVTFEDGSTKPVIAEAIIAKRKAAAAE